MLKHVWRQVRSWFTCPRLSIRAWLLLCALAASLPMLLLAIWLSQRQLALLQAEQQSQLAQRAEAAARAVQHRLALGRAALETLVESDQAHQGDLNGLYTHALRASGHQPDALPITLARQDGALVFSTAYPMGSVLPHSASQRDEQPVFEQGQPVVTPLVRSALSGQFEVMVAVPLHAAGAVRYSLRMALPVRALQGVLEDQQWPAHWLGVIIDERGVIVARSQDSARWAGQSANADLIRHLQSGNRETFESVSKDGRSMLGVIRPIAGTAWHLVLGRTQIDVVATQRQALLQHLVLGALGLGFGALAASSIAVVVSQQVRRLPDLIDATVPMPLHEDTRPVALRPERRAAPSSPVHEIDQVVEHLNGLHQQQLALAHQLHVAQLDPLTQLPARQLFMEVSHTLLESCRRHPNQVLAIFFLDLDGFKSINDRYGHPAGDQVLRQMGALLRASVREGDIAGRVGGDEFVLCMVFERHVAEATSRVVAQRLITGTAAIGSGLGCSVGVVLAFDPTPSLEALIAQADAAMLGVKQSGKNHFAFAASINPGAAPTS